MKGERNAAYWVATGLGSGLSPIVPGTVGTIPFWLAAFLVSQWHAPSILAMSFVSLALIAIGFWAASKAEEVLGAHDPKQIVIDEWAGMAVALIGVPPEIGSYVWAFLFFRFFDVLKPVPARQVEQLPGGYGIVLDDVFAGFYSILAFQIMHILWPAVF